MTRFRRLGCVSRTIGLTLACYWLALFVATHVPVPQVSGLPKHADKGVHFVAYAGLAFLLGLWVSRRRRLTPRHYLFVFIITAIYGAADELLQIPVGRTADLYDWIADCLGSFTGLVALYGALLIFGRAPTTDLGFEAADLRRESCDGSEVEA